MIPFAEITAPRSAGGAAGFLLRFCAGKNG